jgi:hypothetical protein
MQDHEIPIWKEAPFLRIIVPTIAGIAMQWYAEYDCLILSLGIVISILFQFLFSLLPLHIRYQVGSVHGIFLHLIFFFLGMTMVYFSDHRNHHHWYGNFNNVQGMKLILSEEPKLRVKTIKVIASVSEVRSEQKMIHCIGKVLLFFEKDSNGMLLKKGDVIVIKKTPNPITNNGNPGEFDKRRYMSFHHCYEQLYLSQNDYSIIASLRSNIVDRFIDTLQHKTLSILRHFFSDDQKTLGIAEALLATAIGLVAAIPAVIIYNHFARVTKAYLELVGRASGAAARLLSRDLDRTHVGANSRAAE